MLLLLLTLNAFRFLERRLSAYFEQVFVFKMLEVLYKIRNLSSWYETWKITTKIRENKSFDIRTTLWLKWCNYDVKFFQIISVAIALNKLNPALLLISGFKIYSNCSIYSVFFGWKTIFKYGDVIVTLRLVVQLLEVGILWFWRSIF